MSTVKDYIWLSDCINYMNISAVLDAFGDPKTVKLAKKEELLEVLSKSEVEKILKQDYKKADDVFAQCYDKDIKIITIVDVAYPEKLRNIENPPICLYVKGRMPDVNNLPVISVVGTRDCSKYGLNVTKYLCTELAKCGAIIVSGMALGIDNIANKSALYAGKSTIAVLGCSVDICYPQQNRDVYRDIIATGAVISEFPPITQVTGGNFPQRNRIMSGLADGVIIIEAPERSGALITANHAMEQGRDVFAVPGNIDSFCSKGANNLIKGGAIPVTDASDIVKFYEGKFAGLKYSQAVEIGDKIEIIDKKPKAKRKMLGFSKKKEEIKIPTDLSGNELEIYKVVANGYNTPDKIIEKTGLPAHIAMSCLTILEVKLYVERKADKIKIKGSK